MSRPRNLLALWALRVSRAPPCSFAPPSPAYPTILIGCGGSVCSSSAPLPVVAILPSLALSFASSSSAGGRRAAAPPKAKDTTTRRRTDDDHAAQAAAAPKYRHSPREELGGGVAAALGLFERGAKGRLRGGGRTARRTPAAAGAAAAFMSGVEEEEEEEENGSDAAAAADTSSSRERQRRQWERQRQRHEQQGAAKAAADEWAARPTVGARRAASHLEAAVSAALAGDAACRDDLLRAHGLVVHAVRRSPDGREAAVLWDCFPGHEESCASALERRAARLRRAVARGCLKGTRVPAPRLVFRLDRLPPRAAAVAEALDRAEQELEEMGAAAQEEEEGEEDGEEEEDEGASESEGDDADADADEGAPTGRPA